MTSFAFALLFFFASFEARAEFAVPQLTAPVIDEAGVIDRAAEAAVATALRALHDQGGSQITVLTVNSLEGLPIEQASIKVVDAWKLSGRNADTGVLLLIAPKERKMRIEVGRGLEGSLTDADSKRIIDESIRPLFRSGDYSSGVIVGVYQIARKTDPSIDLAPYLEGKGKRPPLANEESPHRLWIIFILILLFLIFGRPSRRRGFFGGGGGWGGGGWSGGGGNWSGGGSGGWSGGGGGFAGGGASGDW